MPESHASELFDAVREALLRDLDRPELTDVVAVERMRRRIVADPTPVSFATAERGPDDQPHVAGGTCDGAVETIGTWADRSAVRVPFGRVLYRMARAVGGDVVELGTGSGLSAAYLTMGLRRATEGGSIFSIDPHPVLARRAAAALDDTLDDHPVSITIAAQEDYFELLLHRVRPRIVHIDSDHTVASMGMILKTLLTVDHPVVACLDDIRWSPGMEGIWNDLCRSVEVVAHIVDLGFWGVVIVDPAHAGPPTYERMEPPAYTLGATPMPPTRTHVQVWHEACRIRSAHSACDGHWITEPGTATPTLQRCVCPCHDGFDPSTGVLTAPSRP